MSKKIKKIGVDAREELAKGADDVAQAVGLTMGPFGQNFFLEKKEKPTNDGLYIANEIQGETEIQNLGVKAIRGTAQKVVAKVADGSSSTMWFSNEVYKTLSNYLPKAGIVGSMKPSEIKAQVDKEKKEIIAKLREMATPIKDEQTLVSSALVSTEDETIAKLIGETQWKLGPDGYLLAEETAEPESSVEIVKGIRIDNGFGTSQIINNPERQTLEVQDVRVILTSQSIKDIIDWGYIMSVVEQIVTTTGQREIVVIARAWTDETIKMCLANINALPQRMPDGSIRGGVKIYPLSAPYVDMQERFKDLEALLGGTFYDSEARFLKDMQISDVGFASKIVARRYDAVITGLNDEKTTERVSKRIEDLKLQLEGSQSEFEKRNLRERIAQLGNGFGIIKVGSNSDLERKRLYDKAEDAVGAVRWALKTGTVPGAGLALKQIGEELPQGYLLKPVLGCIHKQIMSLAPTGFVIEDWVRDPVEVMVVMVEHACDDAVAFVTAGGAIASEVPKGLNEIFQKQLAQGQNE